MQAAELKAQVEEVEAELNAMTGTLGQQKTALGKQARPPASPSRRCAQSNPHRATRRPTAPGVLPAVTRDPADCHTHIN